MASDDSASAEASAAHRWRQLAACIVAMMAIANLQYAWTLFTIPLTQSLHATLSAVQIAFTLFILTETWLVPFEGWLVDRVGARAVVSAGGLLVGISWIGAGLADSLRGLYLFYALGGVGAGAVYGASIGTALKWFPDRRGLAAGLTAGAYGIGTALTVLPIQWMIRTVGYRCTGPLDTCCGEGRVKEIPMSHRSLASLAVFTAVILALGLTAPIHAAQDIVIGLQCDRTGPTQTVGVVLCPGYHDYVDLINSRGGVAGHMIRVHEIDHEYKVPPAIESYERFKTEGAVLVALYGTPQTYALTEKLTEDRIPGTSPGFGRADATDGLRYPYIFPIAATYWSQATAAVKFVKDQLKDLHGKKIAYLFYDNPAGREPLPILEDLAKQEGFELKTFAVPPPGLEMGAQALDLARRFRADFVIAHLFGRAPSVSIKELHRIGYPLNKVVSFVWGSAEADIQAAGGFATADGYYTMQFAGVGSDFPVLKEIRAMYQKAGKEPPAAMASTVYYNRGVLQAALAVEAIRNALQAKPGAAITGDDVKKGFEHIKDFTLGGLVPPLAITPENHEGGGWVQIWQVKGGKLVRVTDWFKAYPEVIAHHLKAPHAA